MATFLDFFRRTASGKTLRNPQKQIIISDPVKAPDKGNGPSDKVLSDLALAEAIYTNNPPWLAKESMSAVDGDMGRPLGVGPLVAQEIACLITIESKIEFDFDEEINSIIQKYIMPNLRMEVEKGWALGGLIFKPYYTKAQFSFDSQNNIVGINGKLHIAFKYPNSFLIEDYDNSGAVLRIKFFDTQTQDRKYYTKVEEQIYDDSERTLRITNTVYETHSAPTKFKWDNLGNVKVPLETVERWKYILPILTFTDVNGCMFGYYRPAVANNGDLLSPYGISSLVRAKEALERADQVANVLDWEVDSSTSRLFVDERSVVTMDNMPKKLGRLITKLVGNPDKPIFEKFAPEIRHESYTKVLNAHLRRVEDIVGLAHGTISEVEEVSRTATEISRMRQRTYATVSDNQKSLQIAISQLVDALRVWRNPTTVADEAEVMYDWDDSVISNPTEQLSLYMLLQNAGNIPAYRTNMMYFNLREDEAKALAEEGQQEKEEAAMQEAEVRASSFGTNSQAAKISNKATVGEAKFHGNQYTGATGKPTATVNGVL